MADATCRLIVPSPDSDIDLTIELSWQLSEDDASCWKRPLTLSISPKRGEWETYLYLSREEGRLLRDYLSVLLASPDLRQNDDDGTITLHSGQFAV